jgi:glycosyltransferase involved in cell wall biosynthesis
VRVTHINTYDSAGGAARAAYRLHTGLLALGQESKLLVQQKERDDNTVLLFDPPLDAPTRFRRMIKRRILLHSRKPLASRPAGSTFMSDDRSEHNGDVLRQMPPSDILNLHWIAGFIDYKDFFRQIPRNLPVVWTLHDMNPFTGGCHFDGGCGKFSDRCGACPQLDSSEPDDFSAQVWIRKKEAFASSGGNVGANHMQIVAPSRWLAAAAKKSSLFGHLPITVIPYGLEIDRFQPRDRNSARQLFEIPPEAKVVLFVADWASEKRKGLDLLLEAIKGLRDIPDLYVLAIGRNVSAREFGVPSKTIDYLRDDLTLSLAYSAADVFVVPSLEDNLPLTALEALACGIPTIAFSAGGMPDVVRDGATGTLVPAGDVQALRSAIASLLGDPQRRARMAEESRRVAVQEYELDVQARRYVELYESILPHG